MLDLRYLLLPLALAAAWTLRPALLPTLARAAEDDDLPARAEAILKKHCGSCHSKDARKLRGKLDVFDRKHLEDPSRGILVAGKPGQSKLIELLTAKDETERMPPVTKTPLTADEIKVLTAWVQAGGHAVGVAKQKEKKAKPAADDDQLAARVKEIFRRNCLTCHGDAAPRADLRVLDHAGLIKSKAIVPGKPEDSGIVQAITAKDENVMPPTGRPPLSVDEIDLVRRWIVQGAAAYPPDVKLPAEPGEKKDRNFKDIAGVDYVLKKVLAHVRDTRRQDRKYQRYLSINHVLVGGATEAELELHRDALAKAINHLSLERRIVRPVAIDPPHNTIFALDTRKLGWDVQPFTTWRGREAGAKSPLDIYDLALLEYPYAVLFEDSETFDHLLEEYIVPAGLARPIAYVRADWFVSVVTQPPLYEDFLRLPHTVEELERRLGVDSKSNLDNYKARRAGMIVSGVSRNNRVVERHPLRDGGYWVSYDFRTSKGAENMFKDPIDFRAVGGEFVFNLPNGLHGYYVADARGERLELAPTEIVTDKHAADKTVRNGLACMRCHDKGIKPFEDTVRPALERLPGSPGFDKRKALDLYAPKAEMQDLIKDDTNRFLASLKQALGKEQRTEPLIPVSYRFLDAPLPLETVAGELGFSDTKGLATLFKSPAFSTLGLVPLSGANGVIRRDAWEDFYDSVVRGLGIGVPVLPLDGLTRTDYPAYGSALKVDLRTNRRGNVFTTGDEMVITVKNDSDRPIWFELIGNSTRGRKIILTPGVVGLRAGESYRYPEAGKKLVIRGATGKEQITLLASPTAFPAGVLLRGKGVTDRVVHPFYSVEMKGRRPEIRYDAAAMVKKTIEIETR